MMNHPCGCQFHLSNELALPRPAGEDFFAKIPAKWAVCLFCDPQHQPLQLVCVKNLRAYLLGRLGPHPTATPAPAGKRVDLRTLAGYIHYQRVHSEPEAQWLYLQCIRAVFPDRWRSMLPARQAWWVRIDPQADIPRFERTENPSGPGVCLGPLADRAAAGKLIDLLQDAFDLCRYETILAQAPNGAACAYKQMGRCAAPCDGSQALEDYRAKVAQAVQAALHPHPLIERLAREMAAAAGQLRFEQAAALKQRLVRLNSLAEGPLSGLRESHNFCGLLLTPGPRKKLRLLWQNVGDQWQPVGGLIGLAREKEVEQLLSSLDPPPFSLQDSQMVRLLHHMRCLQPSWWVELSTDQAKRVAILHQSLTDGKVV